MPRWYSHELSCRSYMFSTTCSRAADRLNPRPGASMRVGGGALPAVDGAAPSARVQRLAQDAKVTQSPRGPSEV